MKKRRELYKTLMCVTLAINNQKTIRRKRKKKCKHAITELFILMHPIFLTPTLIREKSAYFATTKSREEDFLRVT